jgi:hypothetical protein
LQLKGKNMNKELEELRKIREALEGILSELSGLPETLDAFRSFLIFGAAGTPRPGKRPKAQSPAPSTLGQAAAVSRPARVPPKRRRSGSVKTP